MEKVIGEISCSNCQICKFCIIVKNDILYIYIIMTLMLNIILQKYYKEERQKFDKIRQQHLVNKYVCCSLIIICPHK